MPDWILALVILAVVGGIFGWCLWVLSSKHPERLDRLRKNFGAQKEEKESGPLRKLLEQKLARERAEREKRVLMKPEVPPPPQPPK